MEFVNVGEQRERCHDSVCWENIRLSGFTDGNDSAYETASKLTVDKSKKLTGELTGDFSVAGE